MKLLFHPPLIGLEQGFITFKKGYLQVSHCFDRFISLVFW